MPNEPSSSLPRDPSRRRGRAGRSHASREGGTAEHDTPSPRHRSSTPRDDRRRSQRRRRPREERAATWRPFTPEQLAARAASIPVISFPDLPVSARRDDIAAAIRDHQVVIVSGETGSGKTTQLPKICLQLGRGVAGMIGHTQPRRLAAHAVATRIADELGQTVGKGPDQVVGYQVRFTDEVGPSTLVKLMTDGILLAEIQSDPLLRRYDTLIIDEAHERSLNIDFILGYLARLLPLRPDLKVVITSATIDSARFAEHFGRWEDASGRHVAPGKGRLVAPAPVVEVSGRTYPVEVRYRPLGPDVPHQWSTSTGDAASAESPTPGAEGAVAGSAVDQLVLEDPDDDLPTLGYGAGEEIDVEQAICHAVDELCAEGEGDILVFLPGERDIRDVAQALGDHLGERARPDAQGRLRHPDAVEILPLFARLTAAEQHRIFEPHTQRRVVLATNIAETSLTVPGIRYVIDPGLARISRYSTRTKVQRLPIEPVSRASANQRAGRCGRVADGIAIRLYSQRDYESRPEWTEPEILRTSLASVILQMTALGLGSVADFPFLDAPDSRAVRDGLNLLVEIGALAADPGDSTGHRLTPVGRDLARLPIDPRLGRMLLEGDANGCASEVLVIVAALSIQDVRERPLDHQAAADAAHARFVDPTSDFITYLNLWRYLEVQSRDLSGSAFRRMCRAEFLHHLRWREWRDVVGQLRQLARPLDLDLHPIGGPSPEDVARAARLGGLQDAAARAVVAHTASANSVDADDIHRSLLVGLLSNLGTWDEAKRDFLGARGTHFTIWPGSGLAHSHTAWVMTAELVETSRLFARTVARIRPEWVEPVAERAGLLKRVYSEPHWSSSKGAAMVEEKVLLYGMTLVADRPVLLGRLDVTFGGGRRRSSVARPGTLAGIAQGLRGAEPSFDVRITGADALLAGLADESGQGGGELPSGAGGTSDAGTPGAQPPMDEAGAAVDTPGDGAPTAGSPRAAAPSSAMAEETVTARELAREMLIRHGLVNGEWRERHAFQRRNEELLDEAREVERRSRTHGLVADEEALVAFFDDVIPEGVVSARHFNAWWKQERRERPDLLTYPMSLLLPRGTGDDPDAFPDHWHVRGVDGLDLPLSYAFQPGSRRDGVTMTIPVEVLARVSDAGTDWLVPGMVEELVTETIRALPKAKRRLLAPAPEVGARVRERLDAWVSGSVPMAEDGRGAAAPAGSGGAAESGAGRAGSPAASGGGAGPTAGASDGGEVDPMSLEAAMGRLAAWGARTGQARSSQGRSGQGGSGQGRDRGAAGSGSATTGAASGAGANTGSEAGGRDSSAATPDNAPNTSTPARTGASASGTPTSGTTASTPAADAAAQETARQAGARPPFAELFARAIREIRGVDLDESDLAHAADHLPAHLRMTFVVVDRDGHELGAGEDLTHLQRTLARAADDAVRHAVRGAVAEAFDRARSSRDGRGGKGRRGKKGRTPSPAVDGTGASHAPAEPSGTVAASDATAPTSAHGDDATPPTGTGALHADDLSAFPDTPLPRTVDSRGAGGMVLRGYPALVPQGSAAEPRAGVRVMANPADADMRHREGLARLLLVRVQLQTARVTTRWTGREALMLAATPYGDTASLVADAQWASALSLVDELTGQDPSTVRDAAAFEEVARRARDLHEDRVHALMGHVVRAMEALSEVQGAIRTHAGAASLADTVADVRRVVDALVPAGFLAATPADVMPHLARYLRAGAVRLDRAAQGAKALDRDLDLMDAVHDVEDAWEDARERTEARPADRVRRARLEEARWMVEELRVSLFAQQLGTPVKVSTKRVMGLVEGIE